MPRSTFALLVLVSAAGPLAAQQIDLAVDLHRGTYPLSSDPATEGVGLSGGFSYFFATSPVEGRELWRTDGTVGGTIRLTDLMPGGTGSAPTPTLLDGAVLAPCVRGGIAELVFTARSPATGYELWITDGSPGGTRLVKDINPGRANSMPTNLVSLGGEVFFTADDGVHGRELWKTDGTAAGTVLAADVWPGPTGSEPQGLAANAAAGHLWFHAVAAGIGREPHALDLATGTVTSLGNPDRGPDTSLVLTSAAVPMGSRTLFLARGPATGLELWRTDGTAAGTVLLVDIRPGNASGTSRLAPVIAGGLLYFVADDGVTGEELWSTDGTAARTQLVADLEPGPASSQIDALKATPSGRVLFIASTNAHGREPWELRPGSAPAPLEVLPGVAGPNPWGIWELPNGLVLLTWVQNALTLTAFDPTTQTLSPFTSIPSPQVRGDLPGGSLLVAGRNPDVEPYVTDGSVQGSGLLLDIGTGNGTFGARPVVRGTTSDGWILLEAYSPQTPSQRASIWRPGRTSATALGLPLAASPNAVVGEVLASTDDWSLFFADTATHGIEPHVWDRANESASLLRDVRSGSANSLPALVDAQAARIGSWIVFAADDEQHGIEPWITDGTPQGTRMLLDVMPGTDTSRARNFVAYRGRVYFVARDAVRNTEIWVTDGTPQGTSLFVDLEPGLGASPTLFGEFDGDLWFAARTSANGLELWRTDGTVAGTRLAIDLVPGPASSLPGSFAVVGDALVFTATTPATGTELFVTDGTTAGTRVLDVAPGPASGCRSSGLVAAADRVYFRRANTTGPLWVSDLTATGTGPVHWSGTANPVVPESPLEAVGSRVYFGATPPRRVRAIAVAEGREAWTIADSTPFLPDSDRVGALLDGVLYALAIDTTAGDELHAITDVGAAVEDLGDRCGPAWARLDATPPVLGGTVELRGSLAPQGSFGATLLAFTGRRTALPGLLAQECWSHALPFDSALPITFAPTWSQTVPVPPLPALTGLGVVAQSYYLTTPGVPIATSNALRLTLGR